MALLDSLKSLVKDPPPQHVFELSEEGLAYSVFGQTEFERFPAGALVASPTEDNLRRPEVPEGMLSEAVSTWPAAPGTTGSSTAA